MMTDSHAKRNAVTSGLYRTKAEDDLKSLKAAAAVKVQTEIKTLSDAVKHMQEVAASVVKTEGGLNQLDLSAKKKLASIDRSVILVLARLNEFDARVEKLAAEYGNFKRLLLTEIKKEYINMPPPKNKNSAGKPLEILPSEVGEVKRKKRRTAVPISNAVVVAPVVSKKDDGQEGNDDNNNEEEEEEEEDTGQKRKYRKRKLTTEKKKKGTSRVLPVPTTTAAKVIKKEGFK